MREKKTKNSPPLRKRVIIGWRERIQLPALDVSNLIAKIDTGARTAALHAEDIVIDPQAQEVRFRLQRGGDWLTQPLIGQRRVKSTSGHGETRAVIITPIIIGAYSFSTEITLTNRKDMGVPMLLGRASVRGQFIVHPGRSFLLTGS